MSETPAETPAQEQPAAEEPTKPAEEQPAKADETDWKAEARKWEQRSKENKSEADRIAAAQQAQLDAIAKALGLKADEAPDPAKLTEQLTVEQAKAREAAVQLAVYRSPAAKEADVDALLDSSKFQAALKDVDPSDGEAIAQAVAKFVEDNPRFKAATSNVPATFGGGPRPTTDKPDPGPGVARMREAYASTSK